MTHSELNERIHQEVYGLTGPAPNYSGEWDLVVKLARDTRRSLPLKILKTPERACLHILSKPVQKPKALPTEILAGTSNQGLSQELKRQCKAKGFDFVIEADGGTSKNCPPLYGEGYGSWNIYHYREGWPISEARRIPFGPHHSCNSAEITTLVYALRALAEILRIYPSNVIKQTSALVRSDSQIALRWVERKGDPNPDTSPAFQEATRLLKIEVAKFKCVKTQWRGRAYSIKFFGH